MIEAIAGLAAGFVHVLSGPDHLAAMGPLSCAKPQIALRAGFRWGLGHTTGVLIVGSLALLLRESLPLDILSSISERLVGVALIWIGIWGLKKAFSNVWHVHEHKHEDSTHVHIHLHNHRERHDEEKAHAPHTHAALAVGTLHGLAGSGHLFGVLPALALPINSAVIYLAFFAMGSVASMTGFAWVTGSVFSKMKKTQSAYRYSLTGLSCVTITTGCVWLIF